MARPAWGPPCPFKVGDVVECTDVANVADEISTITAGECHEITEIIQSVGNEAWLLYFKDMDGRGHRDAPPNSEDVEERMNYEVGDRVRCYITGDQVWPQGITGTIETVTHQSSIKILLDDPPDFWSYPCVSGVPARELQPLITDEIIQTAVASLRTTYREMEKK